MNVRTILQKRKKKTSSGLWEVGRFRGIVLCLLPTSRRLCVQKKGGGRAGRRNLMYCLLESHEVHNRTQIGITVLESDGKVSVGYGEYTKQDRIRALLHAYWVWGPSSIRTWKIKFFSFQEFIGGITFHLDNMWGGESAETLLRCMRPCLHFICIERLSVEEGGTGQCDLVIKWWLARMWRRDLIGFFPDNITYMHVGVHSKPSQLLPNWAFNLLSGSFFIPLRDNWLAQQSVRLLHLAEIYL